MHKKSLQIFLLISLIFLSLNFISSSDSQLYQSCGGDSQTTIGCLGDSQLFFSGKVIENLNLPTLTIIKPKNQTYVNPNSLKVIITTNADNSWYNLDDGNNETIINFGYFNLSNGLHTIYVFANNSAGVTTKNVTFFINNTKFTITRNNLNGTEKGETTNFTEYSYEEIQDLSNIILEKTGKGKIRFNQAINMTDTVNNSKELDIDSNINISTNFISIDSEAIPNFNKSATLSLYNLNFTNPRILMNGQICPSEICTIESYSSGTLIFNVTHFTNFSAEETPEQAEAGTTGSGGGGGDAETQYECVDNSQCRNGKVCWEHTCVKLFDVKIIDFESSVKLGEFFDFTYFIKGQANISSDVIVSFWIEKDGEKITSGSDTIYLGNFEEKTETTKLFLPTTMQSEVYEFFVNVYHEKYQAQAHRTIEIEVKDGIAIITPVENNTKMYIIFGSVILVLVVLVIMHLKKDMKKKKKLPKKTAKRKKELHEISKPKKRFKGYKIDETGYIDFTKKR